MDLRSKGISCTSKMSADRGCFFSTCMHIMLRMSHNLKPRAKINQLLSSHSIYPFKERAVLSISTAQGMSLLETSSSNMKELNLNKQL